MTRPSAAKDRKASDDFYASLYQASIDNFEAELPVLEAMAERLRSNGEDATIIFLTIADVQKEINRYKSLLNP